MRGGCAAPVMLKRPPPPKKYPPYKLLKLYTLKVSAMAAEESTPAVPAASGAPVETGAGSAAPPTERSVSFTDVSHTTTSAVAAAAHKHLPCLQSGLAEQDLETLDVTKLHPLSPEVISRQATINIGACSAGGQRHIPTPSTRCPLNAPYRHHWACGSWEEHYREVNFRF